MHEENWTSHRYFWKGSSILIALSDNCTYSFLISYPNWQVVVFKDNYILDYEIISVYFLCSVTFILTYLVLWMDLVLWPLHGFFTHVLVTWKYWFPWVMYIFQILMLFIMFKKACLLISPSMSLEKSSKYWESVKITVACRSFLKS